MPPQPAVSAPTETFPRVRRADDPTRLDARRLFEVGEPTVTTGPFSPTDDRVTMRTSAAPTASQSRSNPTSMSDFAARRSDAGIGV